jgi:hypothetical protein
MAAIVDSRAPITREGRTIDDQSAGRRQRRLAAVHLRGRRRSGHFCVVQPSADDWLYLIDFEAPNSPPPVAVPAGVGEQFRTAIDGLIPVLARELASAFASEAYQQQVGQLRAGGDREIQTRSGALGTRARELGLALIPTAQGPIVAAMNEQNPTYENVFGKIEYRQLPGGGLEMDVSLIRAGSLHRANGGVLILRATDIAAQPSVWAYLKAVLRDGEIRIEEFYRAGAPPIAGAPRPIPTSATTSRSRRTSSRRSRRPRRTSRSSPAA